MKFALPAPKSKPTAPRAPASVRLLPAAMITVAAVLGLKAVAVAQDIAETQTEAAAAPADAHAEGAPADGRRARRAMPDARASRKWPACRKREVQVLQALGERRATLDDRASSMDTEGQLLAAAQQRLDERIAELRELEGTVNELLRPAG